MLVVVVLTIREGAIDEFRRYERSAAEIMARYGGAIEHAYELPGDRELHVVRFLDDDAFAAYRADPELAGLRELRDSVIAGTELWPANELPAYAEITSRRDR